MLKIKWLGQAGYILSDGKNTIVIDPYLSDAVNRIAGRKRMYPAFIKAEELKCDCVIITHDHLDHLDVDAIPKMDKSITFYAPSEAQKKLDELGTVKYCSFDMGDKVKIGDFLLEAVFAKHTVPAVGIVVKHSENTLYFTGDTLYDEDLKNIKTDILFICINGKLGNMDVDQALEIARTISPKTAVPNHYDMFESNSEDPKSFTNRINNGFIMEQNKEYGVKNGCLI